MSQSSTLFRLQQIDSQTHQTQQRLVEIETILSQDETLRQAQEHAQQAGEAAHSAHKILRAAEQAVQDQRIKIELTDATLYGGKVRSPKELQDLQHEAASLRKFLSVLEDRQLEAMIGAEEQEAAAQKAQAALEGVKGELAGQQAALRGEQMTLNRLLDKLSIERKAAVSDLDGDSLALYEKIRLARKGVAVTKVTNRACDACGVTLTAAILQAASSPVQLVRCTSCGRILYVA